jgi:hypothetical protein
VLRGDPALIGAIQLSRQCLLVHDVSDAVEPLAMYSLMVYLSNGMEVRKKNARCVLSWRVRYHPVTEQSLEDLLCWRRRSRLAAKAARAGDPVASWKRPS